MKIFHVKFSVPGECPFECKECGKSFPAKSDLTAHAKWHYGKYVTMDKVPRTRFYDNCRGIINLFIIKAPVLSDNS